MNRLKFVWLIALLGVILYIGSAIGQGVYIPNVPDANQPPTNTLGVPYVTNYCAPMAAVNITEYWDVVMGHPNAAGVNAGLGVRTAAEYIGYFMDTNNFGSPARANGTTLPPANGTYTVDQQPGFYEFVRWDAAHLFTTPPPALPAGKNGYDWIFSYLDVTMVPADSFGFNFCAAQIDSGYPVKIDFLYWNPVATGITVTDSASGDTIEFFDWGPPADSSTYPNPREEWNGYTGDEGIGHAVTGVGYFRNIDPDAGGPLPLGNYIVVHDNWPTTPVNVAIFWANWNAAIGARPPSPETVVINEFVPKGTEWIELYNYGSFPVDLTGWSLTDGEGTDNLSGTIPAGGYDSVATTNIALNNSGDDLYLLNSAGDTIDQVIFGNIGPAPISPTGCSVARAPNGSDTDNDANDWTIDRSPTPNAANDAPAPQLGSSLILNEIDPYPSADGDSLELYNPTGSAIDITNWWFSDGDDIIDLSSGGTVPSLGWLVLAEGSGDWPDGVCDFASSDVAYLFNASDVRVDQLGWYGEYNDHSFQRCPDGNGPNDGYDWTSSGGGTSLFDTTATWGAANCVYCEPPQPPSNLICEATDTCIVLNWTNTSEYDSVAVYRSWGGVSEKLLVVLPGSAESYHDASCCCSGNYDYHVTGFHCDEESDPSNTCWVYKLGEVQYSWDFNESDQGWMHYEDPPGVDSWQWGIPTYGPEPGEPTCPDTAGPVPLTNCWATITQGPYLPFSCCRLFSPPIQLDSCGALLEICHWYAMIPDPPDGGNVKVSTDDGNTWQLITPCQGYPFILDTECDKTMMLPGYSGMSPGWVLDYFDLAALGYGDSTVQIAFDFGSNENTEAWPGWYIKWAKIYHCPSVGVEEKHGGLELPTTFALAQNYPNPFNLQTAIRYQIPEDCRVTLEVYNLLGQKVRTLVSGEQKANYYTAYWDGKDAKGNEITSGIYFYTLKAGNFTQTRKMVILK